MRLNSVRLIDFRCLTDQTLELGPRLNFVCGDNGAGKTSILEGIYLLGRPGSFRTAKAVECIRHGCDQAQVIARCEIGGQASVVAMQRAKSGLTLRRDGEDLPGYGDLAQLMPIVAVEPGQHRLIEDGPVVRRRMIDWSVFHVEHQFLPVWRQYSQALRVRNHALRLGDERLARAAEPAFLDLAERVQAMREPVVSDLQGRLTEFLGCIGDDALASVRLELLPGWNGAKGLKQCLVESRAADLERRHTMYGPHRAELRIQADGRAAKALMSRGQRKLLMVGLALAQADQIEARRGNRPVVLIDDFASEWSASTQGRVREALGATPFQFVITMLDAPSAQSADGSMFHVEHGRLHRVI